MSSGVAVDVLQQVLGWIRSGLVGPHNHSVRQGGQIVTDQTIIATNALQPPMQTASQMLVPNLNVDLWRGQRYYNQTVQPNPKKLPVNKGDLWFDGSTLWEWNGGKWVTSTGGTGANVNDTFLTTTVNSDLPNETVVYAYPFVNADIASLDAGKITTGILPIARGGTNLGAYTSGSIIFFDGTSLNQDNAHFFYDVVHGFLGLGTATPSYPFDLQCAIAGANAVAFSVQNSDATMNGQIMQVLNPSLANGNAAQFYFGQGTGTGLCGILTYIYNSTVAKSLVCLSTYGAANTYQFMMAGNGNVGIGTYAASPSGPLFGLHANVLPHNVGPVLGSSATGGLALLDSGGSYGLMAGDYSTGNVWLQVQDLSSATAYALLINPLGGKVGIGTTAPGAQLNVSSAIEIFQTAALTAGSVGSLVIPVNEGSTVSLLTDALAGNLDGCIGGLYDSTGSLFKIGIRLNGLWKHVAVAGFHIPNASKEKGTDGTVGVDETKCPLCKKQMKPGDKLCMVADKWDNGRDSGSGLHAVACHLSCPN